MKKAFGLVFLTLLIFGTSMPVSALDGFESHNFYRAKATDIDNRDFDDDGDDHQNYFEQVIESIGKYEPVNGYSINWKIKIADGTWGYDFGQDGPGAKSANEEIEFLIDSLYVKFEQESFSLGLGLVPAEFGNAYVLQTDGTNGAVLQLRPSEGWALDFFYSKLDENDLDDDGYDPNTYYEIIDPAALSSTDEDGTEDEDLYGFQVSKQLDAGSVKVYWAADINKENTVNYEGIGTEGDLHAIGLSGKYKFGSFEIEGEATNFSGEDKTNEKDFVGNQLHLGATYRFSSGSLQANLYYAQSADSDETQQSVIYKLGKVQPFQQGLGPMLDHDDDNLKICAKPTSIFQITPNSGVIGAGINGIYKPNKPITLSAGLLYLQPEDEDNDHSAGMNGNLTSWTSLAALNLGFNYEFNKNVMLGLGGSYKTFETDDTGDLDPALCLTSMVVFFF